MCGILIVLVTKGLLLINLSCVSETKNKNMCDNKWVGCMVHKICKILLFVGGLNWGLVGVGMLMNADWNVVHMLLGAWGTVEAIVYVLVGVAAVMKLFGCKCKTCMEAHAACCDASGMNKSM